MSERAIEAAARIIDPNCFWDNEPPNSHCQRKKDRALEKARAALAAAQRVAGEDGPLREAARKLANEVSGCWSMAELELRQVLSNTNYNCVAERLEELRAAFAYVYEEADARLIAAASDLLAELKTSACPHISNDAPMDCDPTVEACMARGQCGCSSGDAIRKATGPTDTHRDSVNEQRAGREES